MARALTAGEAVTTHDSIAVAAQSNGLAIKTTPPTDTFSEATFWKHFGVEAIVPLTLGEGEGDLRAVGLLVLGYKQNETPLTREDHEMLTTLANQLAVAVESSNAFDEIQRLYDGLEQQVKDRTRELSDALEELKDAQGQLIDSEMQATLGRLVAGILHELNTPLGTMHSSVGSLRTALSRVPPLLETHPDRDQDEGRRARKALEIIDQLLSLIETSDDRIHGVLGSLKRFVSLDEAVVKPLNLEQSLTDALNVLAPTFGCPITVSTHFPPSPVIIHCHASRINKVFLNLLQNSANSIEGQGEISVTVAREASWPPSSSRTTDAASPGICWRASSTSASPPSVGGWACASACPPASAGWRSSAGASRSRARWGWAPRSRSPCPSPPRDEPSPPMSAAGPRADPTAPPGIYGRCSGNGPAPTLGGLLRMAFHDLVLGLLGSVDPPPIFASGGFVVWKTDHGVAGGWSLGAPVITLEPAAAQPGQAIRCRVSLKPRLAVKVRVATFTAKLEIRTNFKHPTEKCVASWHQVAGVTCARDRALHAGIPVDLEAELPLPPGARCSSPDPFVPGEYLVLWRVEVKLRLAGWPAWEDLAPSISTG